MQLLLQKIGGTLVYSPLLLGLYVANALVYFHRVLIICQVLRSGLAYHRVPLGLLYSKVLELINRMRLLLLGSGPKSTGGLLLRLEVLRLRKDNSIRLGLLSSDLCYAVSEHCGHAQGIVHCAHLFLRSDLWLLVHVIVVLTHVPKHIRSSCSKCRLASESVVCTPECFVLTECIILPKCTCAEPVLLRLILCLLLELIRLLLLRVRLQN